MINQLENPIGPSAQPAEALEIPRVTLLRCADLLALGEINWPSGLTEEQEVALTAEVRNIRRTRLRRFIAARIAADIAREIKDQGKRFLDDQV